MYFVTNPSMQTVYLARQPDVCKNQLWLDVAKAANVANLHRINLNFFGISEEKMSISCTPLSIWFLLTNMATENLG